MNRLVYVAAAAAMTLGLIASDAAADLYRYVDEAGKPHAVSELHMVPGQYRDAAIADLEKRKAEHHGSLNISQDAAESPSTDPTPNASPTPAAPQAVAPAASSTAESNEIGGHEEFWWRSQAELRRKKLAGLQSQLEAAQADDENWSNQIYRGGSKHGSKRGPGPGHKRGRAALLSAADDTDEPTIEELEEAVREAEQDQNEFEHNARSTGVPPGWLRGS